MVNEDLALLPSLAPVIVTVPAETATTSPVASTVATPALLVVQMIARSESTLPASSDAVPVSCVLLPTTASTRSGRTATLATGVFCTVIVAMPDLPPELAATCVVPNDFAVTTPVSDTLAIAGSRTVQRTGRLVIAAPPASWTAAWRGSVEFNESVDAVGLTTTAATSAVRSPVALLPPQDQMTRATTAMVARLNFSRVPRMGVSPSTFLYPLGLST